MRPIADIATFVIYLIAAAFVLTLYTGAEEPPDAPTVGPWRGYARVCVLRDAEIFGCTSLRTSDMFASYDECQDGIRDHMSLMRRSISERLPGGRLLVTTSCLPETQGPPLEFGEQEA